MIIVLGTFTGLRTFYNDTVTYTGIYEYLTPTLSELFSDFNISYADAIGFSVLNSILKTIGASSQDFVMFYGMLTMALYITFLHKYAESFSFSTYLFFVFAGFIFAQAAIKQSIAMALGCWAFHYASNKEWKKYIFITILASLFHPYAIIYFLIPFMTFQPWTGKSYVWIALFVVVAFSLHFMLGTILDITTLMGADYDESSFSGEGVNIFRVLVCLIPTFLSFLFRDSLYPTEDDSVYIIINLTMVNGLIMFVGLFGTANYFARLANFFAPFQLLAVPWIIRRSGSRNRTLLFICSIVCYFLFCYYENGILRPFDITYDQTTLWNYIGEHF